MKKPKTRRTIKTIVKMLKYFSISILKGGPNLYISAATRKNRADLLTAEAKTNIGKLILNAPADRVKTLYGKGVKPAAATAQALYLS